MPGSQKAIVHRTGALGSPQEAAVDSPATYLSSYCGPGSGPCVNPERQLPGPQQRPQRRRKRERPVLVQPRSPPQLPVRPLEGDPRLGADALLRLQVDPFHYDLRTGLAAAQQGVLADPYAAPLHRIRTEEMLPAQLLTPFQVIHEKLWCFPPALR